MHVRDQPMQATIAQSIPFRNFCCEDAHRTQQVETAHTCSVQYLHQDTSGDRLELTSLAPVTWTILNAFDLGLGTLTVVATTVDHNSVCVEHLPDRTNYRMTNATRWQGCSDSVTVMYTAGRESVPTVWAPYALTVPHGRAGWTARPVLGQVRRGNTLQRRTFLTTER